MSSTCGTCDCADQSQCTKKGNSYALNNVETEKSRFDDIFMEVLVAENDGKCKCGTNCTCTDCTCTNCSCGN